MSKHIAYVFLLLLLGSLFAIKYKIELFRPTITANGTAKLMRHAREWKNEFADDIFVSVQVVQDRASDCFVLVVTRAHDAQRVLTQPIYASLKYKVDSLFHQWRNEQKTVCSQFCAEQFSLLFSKRAFFFRVQTSKHMALGCARTG